MSKIEVRHVSKSYGSLEAVHDVSIAVKKGTIHGLIGENGSGKTTLIKCMTGIFRPDAGEVLIDGEPVFENPVVKAKIGYVADSNPFFSGYTIGQMASFYAEMYQTFEKKAFEGYKKLFGLSDAQKVRGLSKGQKMRLAICLNLAIRPEVLILDEPTSGLDAVAKKEVLDLLVEEVEAREMTIFISSHHLAELEKICDCLTLIKGGEVKTSDAIDEVKQSVKKIQAVFPDGLPAGLRKKYEILDLSNTGSIYHLIIRDDSADTCERLLADGALLAEETPISLEEVFIYLTKSEEG